MTSERKKPVALTIAGSDSGGGAGIEADLKAFARCGVHGTAAITAITAQNTVGVDLVEPVSPKMIVAQIRAVASDIGVDAVKIGMLADRATIDAVLEGLTLLSDDVPVVLDPVMVSESGAVLLQPDARASLVEKVIPRSAVVTPNLPEARAIVEEGELGAVELARAIHALGGRYVVVTGGHTDTGEDVFFDGVKITEIPGPRFPDGAAHGSGCTHSSVLAAHLALGYQPLDAAREAKELSAQAIRAGLRHLGAGSGPVDIFGEVNP